MILLFWLSTFTNHLFTPKPFATTNVIFLIGLLLRQMLTNAELGTSKCLIDDE